MLPPTNAPDALSLSLLHNGTHASARNKGGGEKGALGAAIVLSSPSQRHQHQHSSSPSFAPHPRVRFLGGAHTASYMRCAGAILAFPGCGARACWDRDHGCRAPSVRRATGDPPPSRTLPPPRSRTSVSKQGACSPVLCHPSPPLRQWIEREHGMKAWEEGSSHTGAISRPHAHTHPHFATTASLSTSPLTRTRAPSHSLPPCLSLFLALAHRGPRAEKHTHTHTSRGKRPSAWGGGCSQRVRFILLVATHMHRGREQAALEGEAGDGVEARVRGGGTGRRPPLFGHPSPPLFLVRPAPQKQ